MALVINCSNHNCVIYINTLEYSEGERPQSFRLAQRGIFLTDDALIADVEALEEFAIAAVESKRAPPGVSVLFHSNFIELWNSTEPNTPAHELPRQSAINHLLYNLRTGADCELFVPILSRWRRTPLPLMARSTTVSFRNLIRFGRPDLCLTLLADRNRYGPIAYEGDFILIMDAFVRQAIEAAERRQTEAAEMALDRLYATFALAPYYNIKWSNGMYARLVHAGLEVRVDKAWERAVEVAEELWENNSMTYEIADLIYHGFQARKDTSRAEEWSKLRDTCPKPAE
jgi:phosphoribosyl-ATP pyrophosphohydrolase